jgi:hypothetical protein
MLNMAGQQDQESSEQLVKIASGRCAQFPGSISLPTSVDSGFLFIAQTSFCINTRHPRIHARTESQHRIPFNRSSQKRGPPVSVS